MHERPRRWTQARLCLAWALASTYTLKRKVARVRSGEVEIGHTCLTCGDAASSKVERGPAVKILRTVCGLPARQRTGGRSR